MSHVQPLFLLLASFFFLPAFHARYVDFEYCSGTEYDFGSITRVDVSPELDPIGPNQRNNTVTITVHGYASITRNHSNWKLVEVVRKLKKYDIILANDDPCDLIACPVKPGSHFQLSLSDIRYFPDSKLGNKYAVRLLDSDEESRSTELATIFCVAFEITKDSTSVST